MRVRDDDELRSGGDRRADLLGERLPRLLGVQLEAAHLRPEVLGEAPGLEVVRQHQGDLVPRLDQAPADEEVRLRAAGRDEDLLGGSAGVEGGDATAQEVGAVRLAVTEPHLEQRQRRRARDAEQLLHRERMHPRLGEVEAHAVLPRALPALQLERDETQRTPPECAFGRQLSAVSKLMSSGRSSQYSGSRSARWERSNGPHSAAAVFTPAARPHSMSWRESPTKTASPGGAPRRWSALRTGSGCGFGCSTSSDPTIVSNTCSSPATRSPRSAPLFIL